MNHGLNLNLDEDILTFCGGKFPFIPFGFPCGGNCCCCDDHPGGGCDEGGGPNALIWGFINQ